ncbi:MAG: MBL fold metallo-hydrolase [Pseudomonadales bacterium]|nr:MBL fold metallo-hydrolase [Pseudomonadales bacterium]
MSSWKIGDITIERVPEMVSPMDPTMLLPEATPENMEPMHDWLKPHFLNDDNTIPLSIHAFLITTPTMKILVDTCIGNDKPRAMPMWNELQGDFLEQLTARGAPKEAINTVLCTHLHVDHVGWNTMLVNGKWIPTFDNARYLFAKTEWDFWKDEEDPFGPEAKNDSILPIIESDQIDLVDTNHQVTEGVQLIPTPGHTPGHVSVLITSGNERAVITGDLFHHPVQFARPFWLDIADTDGDVAAQSRLKFMADFNGSTLVLGTHFALPTGGHLIRDGQHYRFKT